MVLADIPFDQLNEIGRVGVVGALALLAIWRVVVLEREKTKAALALDVEREKHKNELVSAYKEVGELMAGHTITQQATNAGQEARTAAVSAMADGMKAQAAALKDVASALDRNSETTRQSWSIINDAAKSNRDLRETLLTKVVRDRD